MALPGLNELKLYLKIEHTAEDTLLTALLARARAQIEAWCDTPITPKAQIAYDPPGPELPSNGNGLGKPLTALVFPRRPIDPEAVEITDADDEVVDPETYRIDSLGGMIFAKRGVTFSNPPYKIEAEVGMELFEDWTSSIEAVVGSCLIDLAADLYTHRTPGAASENAAGTQVTWDVSRGTSERVLRTLKTLKLPIAM